MGKLYKMVLTNKKIAKIVVALDYYSNYGIAINNLDDKNFILNLQNKLLNFKLLNF